MRRECIVCKTMTDGSVGENSFIEGIPLCRDCCDEWSDYAIPKIEAMKGKFSKNWKKIFEGWLRRKGIYLGIEPEVVIFT